MIKIAIWVRNRLGITKKCIEAIEKQTKLPYKLYIFDNLTDYRVDEHFDFYKELYQKKKVAHIAFNTKDSTYNAFSKAVASNTFGKMHMDDPNGNSYAFLVMLDNDMLVTPGWDDKLHKSWQTINRRGLNKQVKIITQSPGGVMGRKPYLDLAGIKSEIGTHGGSGLWSVGTDFFKTVGFLNLKQLVGQNKKHDQMYWQKLKAVCGNRPYVVAIKEILAYHGGPIAGSICNVLTKTINKDITFALKDQEIEKMDLNTLYIQLHNLKAYKW